MKQGFTLLELSIVLVIIGLIIGGITTGASMIRSAELNSIVSDINKFQTAFNVYRLQYNAIPGDHKDAARFWPSTTSGDGDRQFDMNGEQFRAWEHLALAELISGSFTGVAGSGSARDAVIGENIPAGSITGSGYSIYRHNSAPGHPTRFDIESGKNHIELGAELRPYESLNPIFLPSEAHGIDSKIDDGNPSSGKIWTQYTAQHANCTTPTNSTGTNAAYKLDETENRCGLHFAIGN